MSIYLRDQQSFNRHFNVNGKGWMEIPSRVYFKIDDTDPLDPVDADYALFMLDSVDADWLDRAPWPELNPKINATDRRNAKSAYWSRLNAASGWSSKFGAPPPKPPEPRDQMEDPYSDMPTFRIEIMLSPNEPLFDQFVEGLGSPGSWFIGIVDGTGEPNANVYGSLFAEPTPARLSASPASQELGETLEEVFSLDDLPDAPPSDLQALLDQAGEIACLGVYDVGQGSANGLLAEDDRPHFFYDLGCGVYRNKRTAPSSLNFCWSRDPFIILSHWDSDHWAAAHVDRAALGRTWLAPRQSVTSTHIAFATEILRAGGRLLLWGSSPSAASFALSSSITGALGRCTGSGRNGSGLALCLENAACSPTRSWLLTGDAGYSELPPAMSPPSSFGCMVPPHHGASMGNRSRSIPSPDSHSSYHRLAYSFGPGNAHGRTSVPHPRPDTVRDHDAQGWPHGSWSSRNNPGHTVAGADVLATAEHPSCHLGGCKIGWFAPPTPMVTTPCSGKLCDTTLGQV